MRTGNNRTGGNSSFHTGRKSHTHALRNTYRLTLPGSLNHFRIRADPSAKPVSSMGLTLEPPLCMFGFHRTIGVPSRSLGDNISMVTPPPPYHPWKGEIATGGAPCTFHTPTERDAASRPLKSIATSITGSASLGNHSGTRIRPPSSTPRRWGMLELCWCTSWEGGR